MSKEYEKAKRAFFRDLGVSEKYLHILCGMMVKAASDIVEKVETAKEVERGLMIALRAAREAAAREQSDSKPSPKGVCQPEEGVAAVEYCVEYTDQANAPDPEIEADPEEMRQYLGREHYSGLLARLEPLVAEAVALRYMYEIGSRYYTGKTDKRNYLWREKIWLDAALVLGRQMLDRRPDKRPIYYYGAGAVFYMTFHSWGLSPSDPFPSKEELRDVKHRTVVHSYQKQYRRATKLRWLKLFAEAADQ